MSKENWNFTAKDYAQHRAGFPDWFFDRLGAQYNLPIKDAHVLDLGTGTGLLARGFALRGAKVTGLDVAAAMIEAARQADHQAGIEITYHLASADNTGLPSESFDLVAAATCWHWFQGAQTAKEVWRLLKPGGWALICMLSWLPLPGNIVEQTEWLVEKHNPHWKYGGMHGLKPEYLSDLFAAGFKNLQSFSIDYDLPYSHESWRGRMRASAGVSATLSFPQVEAFDQDLALLLAKHYPGDTLAVPHRIFAALGQKL